MCGRYGRFSRKERIEGVLERSIEGPGELEPRYNVCPGLPDALASYILMTTQPNELAAKVHDRMPVMLHARDVALWLDPAIREPERVVGLLAPHPAQEMASRPVSKRVSDPDNEGPELIKADNATPELWS